MPNNAYCDLLNAEASAYPLFHQPWWLDIVCGGNQHWLGVVSKKLYKGKAAVMPVPMLPKWRFLPTVRRPLLTPYLGPWWPGLHELPDSAQFQLSRQVWPDLIAQLPSVPYFHHTLRPELVHALPFHTAGYRLQARYSYRLQSGELHFNRNNRRALKRASNLLVWQAESSQVLYDLLADSFAQQGQSPPFPSSLMEDLHQAASNHGQSQIWVSGPNTQEAQAAIWVLWDAFCIYVLSNGVAPAGRESGAYPRLIAQVLEQPPVAGLPIDLCGTMLPQVTKVNVGLGAEGDVCIDLKRGRVIADWLINGK